MFSPQNLYLIAMIRTVVYKYSDRYQPEPSLLSRCCTRVKIDDTSCADDTLAVVE